MSAREVFFWSFIGFSLLGISFGIAFMAWEVGFLLLFSAICLCLAAICVGGVIVAEEL